MSKSKHFVCLTLNQLFPIWKLEMQSLASYVVEEAACCRSHISDVYELLG